MEPVEVECPVPRNWKWWAFLGAALHVVFMVLPLIVHGGVSKIEGPKLLFTTLIFGSVAAPMFYLAIWAKRARTVLMEDGLYRYPSRKPIKFRWEEVEKISAYSSQVQIFLKGGKRVAISFDPSSNGDTFISRLRDLAGVEGVEEGVSSILGILEPGRYQIVIFSAVLVVSGFFRAWVPMVVGVGAGVVCGLVLARGHREEITTSRPASHWWGPLAAWSPFMLLLLWGLPHGDHPFHFLPPAVAAWLLVKNLIGFALLRKQRA